MPTFSHGRSGDGTPLPTEPNTTPTTPDTIPTTPDATPNGPTLAHFALSVGAGGGKSVVGQILRQQIDAGATVWGRSA
ncbi:hypothetical protein [Streptomyces sp. NPDC005498]|uniref:hypothetical protein n=1 Tax=Streptomyces sp. NPDC005498 TaxID=3364717 RepID=UPI0036925362